MVRELTIAINFLSSKDNNEERVTHSESDTIEIMINDEAGEVIEEFFQALPSRYQIGLETSMRGSDSAFDCIFPYLILFIILQMPWSKF